MARLWAGVSVALLLVALMVISNHVLNGSHANEAWDSLRVLDRFQQYNRGDGGCARLEVAACWLQNGQQSYTVRAYCEFDNGSGIMGLWGNKNGESVYVTGYALDRARWEKLLVRDQCAAVDLTMLTKVLR